jgi:hypothetical protein
MRDALLTPIRVLVLTSGVALAAAAAHSGSGVAGLVGGFLLGAFVVISEPKR